jgi:hypothetical protein
MVFKSWTTSEVCRHLKTLGFGDYVDAFKTNEITGTHLPRLTEDHLKELGILSIGHRILLLRRISDIASGRSVSSLPPAPGHPPSKPAADPAPAARKQKAAIPLSPNVDDVPKRSPPFAADHAPAARKQKAAIPISPQVEDVPKRSPPDDTKRAADPRRRAPVAAVRDLAPRDESSDGAAPARPRNVGARDDWSDSSSGQATVDNRRPIEPEKRSPAPRPPRAAPAEPGQRHSDSSSGHGSGTEFGGRKAAPKEDRQIMASRRGAQTFVTADGDDDQRVTCQYCGRKMKPDAARRHIPVCGRMNSGKNAKK